MVVTQGEGEGEGARFDQLPHSQKPTTRHGLNQRAPQSARSPLTLTSTAAHFTARLPIHRPTTTARERAVSSRRRSRPRVSAHARRAAAL